MTAHAGWPTAAPRILIVALALLAGAACSPGLALTPAARPTERGAPDVRAEETRLLGDALVHEDAELAEYLETIVDRLLSEEERSVDAPPIAVTVLRDPTLSAFALPTGRIFVHTGLLARLENEAQLALVLARELAHLARRQELGHAAGDGPLTDALAGVAPMIARALAAAPRADESTSSFLSPVARVILGSRLVITYTAAVDGYGPAAAGTADADAVARLQRAGYLLNEAPRTLERLRREAQAGGTAERFFYGNGAALAERAAVIGRLAASAIAAAGPGETSTSSPDAFTRHITRVRRDNARLELGAGRFRLAQDQLDHALGADPPDALTHLIHGDLARLRAQRARSIADRDELLRGAAASYERCLALDPGIAQVHHQLGLLYYQLRQLDAARAAFARYVTLAPDAPDAARAREYLAER